MPRLSATGVVAAGIGDGSVSIYDVVVGHGGSPAWLTDEELAYAATMDGHEYQVQAYSLITEQTRVLATTGANDVKAGGGRWARYLADGTTGLTDSTGFGGVQFGLHDVGPDGVLYYKPNLERGIVARFLDGMEVVISTTSQVLNLRGVQGGCLWVEGTLKVMTWNLPPPVMPTGLGAYSPRAALVNGEWWLAYGDGRRILAQPFGEPKGYVVADLGNTFDLDCVALNGTLRVAYATTSGEQPGQTRVLDLDLTRPRTDLAMPAGSTGPPPIKPPAPHITILSYFPSQGPAPLRVKAIRGLSGGQADRIMWRARTKGAPTWVVVANNPASDDDHTFLFKKSGTYEIGCDVIGPGGTDGTSKSRIVKVLS